MGLKMKYVACYYDDYRQLEVHRVGNTKKTFAELEAQHQETAKVAYPERSHGPRRVSQGNCLQRCELLRGCAICYAATTHSQTDDIMNLSGFSRA